MANAHLEDLHGVIEVVIFPRTYAANPEVWREDNIVIVSGKVDVRRMESSGDEESHGVPEILADGVEEWIPGPDDVEEAPILRDEPEPELLDWAGVDVAMVAEEPANYLVLGLAERRAEDDYFADGFPNPPNTDGASPALGAPPQLPVEPDLGLAAARIGCRITLAFKESDDRAQ